MFLETMLVVRQERTTRRDELPEDTTAARRSWRSHAAVSGSIMRSPNREKTGEKRGFSCGCQIRPDYSAAAGAAKASSIVLAMSA